MSAMITCADEDVDVAEHKRERERASDSPAVSKTRSPREKAKACLIPAEADNRESPQIAAAANGSHPQHHGGSARSQGSPKRNRTHAALSSNKARRRKEVQLHTLNTEQVVSEERCSGVLLFYVHSL